MIFKRITVVGLLLMHFLTQISGFSKKDFCTLKCTLSEHLACNNYGIPGKDCPKSVNLVNMLQFRNKILKMHNIIRDDIASGSTQLQGAARMATMQWCHNLADMATLKVLTCNKMQNLCISTPENNSTGQNVGIYRYTDEYRDANEINLEDAFQKHVTTWFENGDSCTDKVMHNFSINDGDCASLAVMINDRSTHVGCAASRYIEEGLNTIMMACNYKYKNIVGQPVYKFSHDPASECKTYNNKDYFNLCNIEEEYD